MPCGWLGGSAAQPPGSQPEAASGPSGQPPAPCALRGHGKPSVPRPRAEQVDRLGWGARGADPGRAGGLWVTARWGLAPSPRPGSAPLTPTPLCCRAAGTPPPGLGTRGQYCPALGQGQAGPQVGRGCRESRGPAGRGCQGQGNGPVRFNVGQTTTDVSGYREVPHLTRDVLPPQQNPLPAGSARVPCLPEPDWPPWLGGAAALGPRSLGQCRPAGSPGGHACPSL